MPRRGTGLFARGRLDFLRGFSGAMSHKSLEKCRAWLWVGALCSDIDRPAMLGASAPEASGLESPFLVTGMSDLKVRPTILTRLADYVSKLLIQGAGSAHDFANAAPNLTFRKTRGEASCRCPWSA